MGDGLVAMWYNTRGGSRRVAIEKGGRMLILKIILAGAVVAVVYHFVFGANLGTSFIVGVIAAVLYVVQNRVRAPKPKA
jgi:hypothetical protein